MSSISATGSSLFQYLQSITGSQQSSPSAQAAQTAADTDGDSSSSVQSTGHHHGGHGGGQGGLLNKITDALTNALQSSQSTGEATTPGQALQNAIANLLSGQPASATTPTTTSTTNQTNPLIAEETNSPEQSDSAGDASPASFLQTLQNFGIEPEQFRQDFLTATQNAGPGQQTNAATLSQAFPPGSLVDTTA